MSIVRWGEDGSNVYIIGTDKWECVGCDGPDSYSDGERFLNHLKWHRDQGHCVPEYVADRIKKFEPFLTGTAA